MKSKGMAFSYGGDTGTAIKIATLAQLTIMG